MFNVSKLAWKQEKEMFEWAENCLGIRVICHAVAS